MLSIQEDVADVCGHDVQSSALRGGAGVAAAPRRPGSVALLVGQRTPGKSHAEVLRPGLLVGAHSMHDWY